MNEENIYTRTEMMLGAQAIEKLRSSRVLVVGVGGVGGYVVEALARAGVSTIGVLDSDCVAPSNLNRQIIATRDTLGLEKVEAARRRILSINPEAQVLTYPIFYSEQTEEVLDLSSFDYVVDAIDSVRSKLLLVKRCTERGVRIISSMGTGNKLDPTRFKITDISKTHTCPLAKVMRTELRKMGINHLKVLFSDEEPVKTGERTPGSVSFVPSVAGLIIGGEVIKDLIG